MSKVIKRVFGLAFDPQHDAERGEMPSILTPSEAPPGDRPALHSSTEGHPGFTFQPPTPATEVNMEVDAQPQHLPSQPVTQSEGLTPNTFAFSAESREQTPAEEHLVTSSTRSRRSRTPAGKSPTTSSSQRRRKKLPAGALATPKSQIGSSAEAVPDVLSKVRVVPSTAPLGYEDVKESINASVEALTSRAELAEQGQRIAAEKADEAARTVAAALARMEVMMNEVQVANTRATKAEEAAQGALQRAEKAEKDALQAVERAERAEKQAHLAMQQVTAANQHVVDAEVELGHARLRTTRAEQAMEVVLERAKEAEKRVELLEERLARAEDDEREVAALVHTETDDKVEMGSSGPNDTNMEVEEGSQGMVPVASSPSMHTLAYTREERVVLEPQAIQGLGSGEFDSMSTSESETSEREKIDSISNQEMEGSAEDSDSDMYGSQTPVRMVRLRDRSHQSEDESDLEETPTPGEQRTMAIEREEAASRPARRVDGMERAPQPAVEQQRAATSARQQPSATTGNNQASQGAGRHQTVPPPQTFSRPRSGANSNITIQMPTEASMTREQSRRHRRRANVAHLFSNNSDEDDDSETEIVRNTQRYADGPKSKYFTQPRRKGYNQEGAAFKTAVRELMNELMGMQKNEDIVDIRLADDEDLYEFRNGTCPGPSPKPIRPYFDGKNVIVDWNSQLAELFADEFTKRHNIAPTEEEAVIIEDAFLKRLGTLRKEFHRLVGKTKGEIKVMKDKANGTQRPSTCRNNLWMERRDICLENSQGPDGAVDPQWRGLLYMVDKLTPAGMSSDESDFEAGRPIYVVKWRKWRSREVQGCLEAIDSYANRSGGDGRIRPGNAPRQRIRSRTARASKRDPPVGCPQNYYTEEFTAGLSNRAHRELDMTSYRALPRITRNRRD